VPGTQPRKFLASLPINLVDSGHIRQEEQLLPDFFESPVRDGVDQRMQDSVPSFVIHGFRPLVQLQDYISRRIEVVQN
jgi:hypothetical protein